MFPEEVVNVLSADNPWLEGQDRAQWVARFLPRPYLERRMEITVGDSVGLVIGPRQAGKSTLVWKTLSQLNRACLYVNCEERAVQDWAVSPALFIQGLEQLVPADTIVFFEEVQRLDEAGLFLKGLVDRKSRYRFLATGSSSYELDARTRESLAGRAERQLLLPLSHPELTANFEGPSQIRRRRRLQTATDLALFGGYPSVVLGDRKENLLTGLVESFVIRDASDRFRIKHTAAFRKLLQLMASQIGNLCNFSEWSSVTGVSADTVSDYAALLEDTHVVKLIRPFVGGKRAEITSAPKVYFVDMGIRNRLFGGFGKLDARPDKGALIENYVFTELYKAIHPLMDRIQYWRSKGGAEVDFVVSRGDRLIAVEVKAGKTRGRLSRAARSFIDAYAPDRFWIISTQDHPTFSEGKTVVQYTTLSDIDRILGGRSARFLAGNTG